MRSDSMCAKVVIYFHLYSTFNICHNFSNYTWYKCCQKLFQWTLDPKLNHCLSLDWTDCRNWHWNPVGNKPETSCDPVKINSRTTGVSVINFISQIYIDWASWWYISVHEIYVINVTKIPGGMGTSSNDSICASVLKVDLKSQNHFI